MKIETAQEAIETYKSFDDWRYADREAAWKWMFEQGWNAALEKAAKLSEKEDGYILADSIRALKEE